MTATNWCSTAAASDAGGVAVLEPLVLEVDVEVVRPCPPHPLSASAAETSARDAATRTSAHPRALSEGGDSNIGLGATVARTPRAYIRSHHRLPPVLTTDLSGGIGCDAEIMNTVRAPAIARAGESPRRARPRLPGWLVWLVEHRAQILAVFAFAAIVVGGLLHLVGEGAAGQTVWGVAVAVLAAELTVEVGRTVVVEHSLGVDTIALVAMVGALALGEELAGVVIGLMFSGGAALEAIASRRARRELTALVQRAPKIGAATDRATTSRRSPVERVEAGDVVLVRTGEVVPVDGTLISPEAVIDTSTLSGEPLPETVRRGMRVLSGCANAGAPFDVRADRPARDSAYAALVRLVEQAQTQRAPMVRMADRYAGFFLPATLLTAGLAWALSGDPVRALAVVVVATPCPLILAAPIALCPGLSRAARSGVIVKGAGAIETLGEARTVLFDKTGTLTVGTPEVREIVTRGGWARGAAAAGRLGRPPLGARSRRGAGRGRQRGGTRADHARRRPRRARPGDRGPRRRPPRGGRQPRVRARHAAYPRRRSSRRRRRRPEDPGRRTSWSRSMAMSPA